MLKSIKSLNDLKKSVEKDGFIKNEKEINDYYKNNDTSTAALYKAKLEFLKGNYKEAKELIVKDYIPISGENNYSHYFLTLCNLSLKQYEQAYSNLLKINTKEKMNISEDEYNGLKAYLQLQSGNKIDVKDDSYIVNQVKKYNVTKTIKENNSIDNPRTRFLVDEDRIENIIDLVERYISKSEPAKTLDMYDKYYFYFKNISVINNQPANVIMVKTLRNSNKVLFIEPQIPKKASIINPLGPNAARRFSPFIAEDLENEIELNGLVANEKNINWLFNKFPFIKSIALYKVKLECALGNNKEAVRVIKEDYIPTFGGDNKIFFVLLDLYCNLGKNLEAYQLLNIIDINYCNDDLFVEKYRYYRFMLESYLGIIDIEIKPETYEEKQLIDYNDYLAAKEIFEYNHDEDNPYSLELIDKLSESSILEVMNVLSSEIPDTCRKDILKAQKTYRNDVLDSYYFNIPKIGRNKKTDQYTNCLCVLTKKSTNEIIKMFPVKQKSYYIINELVKEEKKTNSFR